MPENILSGANPARQVVHVTSWLSRNGGGIPPVIWALASETNQRGFACSVFGLRDQWTDADCARYQLPLAVGNVVGPKALGYSPGLVKQLNAQLSSGGIVHSHGLWMHPGLAARQCAHKTGCRLVISPHGMLEPWALNNSRFKKRLVAKLFENKNLVEADCLHALCTAEAENFRRYGLKNPIAVIPNGVSVDELVPPATTKPMEEKFPELKGRRRILFLSRLHPKKGLENLLEVWRRLSQEFTDWCLVIAGSGEPAYEQQLRHFASGHGLQTNVIFSGPLYGGEKKQILAMANIFALPSFSEGFSVAILEAAAAGLPVLLTRECNFSELAGAGAALEVAPEVLSIEKGLRHLIGLTDEQRKDMGRRAAELVNKSYTWPTIAAKMCRVYQWLGGQAEKPDTVTVL